jgi:hypothetical protein
MRDVSIPIITVFIEPGFGAPLGDMGVVHNVLIVFFPYCAFGESEFRATDSDKGVVIAFHITHAVFGIIGWKVNINASPIVHKKVVFNHIVFAVPHLGFVFSYSTGKNSDGAVSAVVGEHVVFNHDVATDRLHCEISIVDDLIFLNQNFTGDLQVNPADIVRDSVAADNRLFAAVVRIKPDTVSVVVVYLAVFDCSVGVGNHFQATGIPIWVVVPIVVVMYVATADKKVFRFIGVESVVAVES